MDRSVPRRRARYAAAAALLGLVAGCAGGGADGDTETAPSVSPPTSEETPTAELEIAVYGPEAVTEVYRQVAEAWSARSGGVEVEVVTYPNNARAMAGLSAARAAGDPPDLFLADRNDLAVLQSSEAIRRVDDLLAAREVDFGDGFSRRGLEAFGQDAALQCMPVDVSPLVVYYNPQLIDLTEIAEEGGTPITQERGWRLEEFARAASQPRSPGVRGLHVAPTIEQIAPFVWSGGGTIADSDTEPTTLTFSSDSAAEAMEDLLTVVRDPGLTFGERQLERQSALERFEAGRLGMILGHRDLTARFRNTPELIFDVMPMPVIDTAATSGRMKGLCISADSPAQEQAADLLVELVGTDAQDALAETGYVMPSNLQTLASEAFLQSGQRPLHSSVFGRRVRDVRPLPVSESWAPTAAVASRQFLDLFYDSLIDPLEERLEAIDAASEPLLSDVTPADDAEEEGADPDESPSPSPGDDGS